MTGHRERHRAGELVPCGKCGVPHDPRGLRQHERACDGDAEQARRKLDERAKYGVGAKPYMISHEVFHRRPGQLHKGMSKLRGRMQQAACGINLATMPMTQLLALCEQADREANLRLRELQGLAKTE